MTESPPEQDEWAQRALHCWNWCGGWHPERWPVYAVFHDVSDWALLVELLETLNHLRSQEA